MFYKKITNAILWGVAGQPLKYVPRIRGSPQPCAGAGDFPLQRVGSLPNLNKNLYMIIIHTLC